MVGWLPYLLEREWVQFRRGALRTARQSPIAAGATHSIFIDASSHILTCGLEQDEDDDPEEDDDLALPGLLGQGSTLEYGEVLMLEFPVAVPTMARTSVCSVAAGQFSSFALGDDGAVYSFGPGLCCLGHGDWEEQCTPRRIQSLDGVRICSVAAGTWHSVALTQEGALFTWGGRGQGLPPLGLGYNQNHPQMTPKRVNAAGLDLERCTFISAGCDFTLVVCESGTVFSFGIGSAGQLGLGNLYMEILPREVVRLHPRMTGQAAIAVAAGYVHSLALDEDGRVSSWGGNGDGCLGIGIMCEFQQSPVLVEMPLDAQQICRIAAGEYHSCAVDESGMLFTWGSGSLGRLGHGDAVKRFTPCPVRALTGHKVVFVTAGHWHTLVVADDGSVFGFGLADEGRIGVAIEQDIQSLPQQITQLRARVVLNGVLE